MFLQYLIEAMKLAKYEKLENGTYDGSIPEFEGVWANESTKKKCEKVLREVAEEWILLKVYRNGVLPSVRGKRLIVPALSHS